MSQGTIYHKGYGREIAALAVIKDLGLDVKESAPDAAFEAAFPLKKVPSYLSADGKFALHETIAIVRYLTTLKPNTLFGSNGQEESEVLKWLSLTNGELVRAVAQATMMIRGLIPYNKKALDGFVQEADTYAAVYEAYLTKNTYLVGERITAADFMFACVVRKGLSAIWAKEWAAAHPATMRWFWTVRAYPALASYIPDFELLEEPLKFTPPKKEEKPKAEAKPKAKAAAPAEDLEDLTKEKKVAHPIAALGNAKMAIDEWKRTYSNEETREVALPWFWEHYNPEEYSLWKVAYKYNDELTLTFMSNNLIGGFFNRLSASTKYLFGCMVVYGENNKNGIVGVFLVRGQDYAPAFDVAPDWESYDFTKLDASKPEDKEYVNDLWAWDKPLDINGEKKEVADGKVFK